MEERIRLDEAFADFNVARPSPSRSAGAEIAISPAQRSAMIYALDPDSARRDGAALRGRRSPSCEGVDLTMWLQRDGEAVIRGRRGELRFTRRRRAAATSRGERWSVEGDLAVLRAEIQDGRLSVHRVPGRAGARLVGAALPQRRRRPAVGRRPGYEFVDWGGSDHVGGGSHGSLHRSDSLGALLWCGTGSRGIRPRAPASSGPCATSPRSSASISA